MEDNEHKSDESCGLTNDNGDNIAPKSNSTPFAHEAHRGPRIYLGRSRIKYSQPLEGVLISRWSNDRSAYDSSGTLSMLSSNKNNHCLLIPCSNADELWQELLIT